MVFDGRFVFLHRCKKQLGLRVELIIYFPAETPPGLAETKWFFTDGLVFAPVQKNKVHMKHFFLDRSKKNKRSKKKQTV